tara:strand:- start:400 stop:582 length:183 start_codon:yes stop_codon:yes gene_type:complete
MRAENLMTTKEACEFLRMSRNGIYLLIKNNPKFPVFQLSKKGEYRFSKEKLIEWLQKEKQ